MGTYFHFKTLDSFVAGTFLRVYSASGSWDRFMHLL